MDGRVSGTSPAELLQAVFETVPEPERKILTDVARNIPESMNVTDDSLRVWIVREVDRRFEESRICNQVDPAADQYEFADAISIYLHANNLADDRIFQTPWDSAIELDLLTRIILALTLQAQVEVEGD